MLKIPEFGMFLDAPADHGLAVSGGITLFAPLHGRFGLGVVAAGPGDDPNGDLEETYALMAALGPVGSRGGTFLNRRDPEIPFLGAIKNPHSGALILLVPFNHAGLTETQLRGECARLVGYIGFVSPAMTRWNVTLSGRRFTAAEDYRRDLRSGDGFSHEETIVFRTDGRFERRICGHTSISSGGLSLGRVRDDRDGGLWDVIEVNDQPTLRIEGEDGRRSHWTLGRTGDAILLDGRRFVGTG